MLAQVIQQGNVKKSSLIRFNKSELDHTDKCVIIIPVSMILKL